MHTLLFLGFACLVAASTYALSWYFVAHRKANRRPDNKDLFQK